MFRIALFLLLLPLVEIFLFIELGGAIGAGWTILLVLGTAMLGLGLLRRQGVENFRRTQASLRRGEIPIFEILDRFVLGLAGIFLFVPGFFTDAVGLLLFVPVLRGWAIRRLLRNIQARRERSGRNDGGAQTIEADYHVEGENKEKE